MHWTSAQLGREVRENLVGLATRCLGIDRRSRWRHTDHPPPGICHVCRYDMRALEYPCLCPECGSWPDTRWDQLLPDWAGKRSA